MFYTPQIFGFPNSLLENKADKSFLFCLLCSALQFSLTTLTTEFFCFFLKIFLIMMCSYNFTVNMHSGYYLQCFYTLYLCIHVKLLSNALRTHRFVERVTQRILHEFKNSSIGIVYSNWNVKNRHHAGPVHETLVPTPTTTTHPHTDTDTH